MPVQKSKRVIDLLIYDVATYASLPRSCSGQPTIEPLRGWKTDAGEGGRYKVIISGDSELPLSLCTPPEGSVFRL